LTALWDYHTHCELNHHAKGRSRDYVESAVRKGLREIGLSDHFPMYLLPESADVWRYAMTMAEFDVYFAENQKLRQEYASRIQIKLAAEVDYFQASFAEYQKILKPYLASLDYIIGSIHVVAWDGVPAWGVDDEKFLAKFAQFGPDTVYREYYHCVEGMVRTGYYNIVGHIDLPKKFGIRPDHPDVIYEQLLTVLDLVAAKGMAVEINTSGLLKPVKEQYPAENVLKACIDRKIPITLGSDSHDPVNVGYGFEDVLKLARKNGLTHLCSFTSREKSLIPL
jgi:histidinol-phosphatase (PHP family)